MEISGKSDLENATRDDFEVKKASCLVLVIIYSGFTNGHTKRTIKGTFWSLRCFIVDPRPSGIDCLNTAQLQPLRKSGMVCEKPK